MLQQVTLDALLSRCECHAYPEDSNEDECWFEAASVLAGTILMASGTSGDGPARHDSNVTLSTLLPHIASLSRRVLRTAAPANRRRSRQRGLREEAERTRQPFGAARQHLNHELARRRAMQMQQVHLA